METAACLRIYTATKGVHWRHVPTLRFLLALEFVRLTATAAMEAPGLDRADSFSPQKQSNRVYWPVKSREGQAASTQQECSLQKGKARLVPAGRLFHRHTQHAPLCFLTSPKRHRLPCVSLPESVSRSRLFCIKHTASTEERRRCSSAPVAIQKPAVPQEDQDLNCSKNASRLPPGGTVTSGRRSEME